MIEQMLIERGMRYGHFRGHARITQGLKRVMQAEDNWGILDDDMLEALDQERLGGMVKGAIGQRLRAINVGPLVGQAIEAAMRDGRVTEQMKENARPSNWAREQIPDSVLAAANAGRVGDVSDMPFAPSANVAGRSARKVKRPAMIP